MGYAIPITKTNAILMLPLVQAIVDGKTIQVKTLDGDWRDLKQPKFDSPLEVYRIKPEPVYEWLVSYTVPKPGGRERPTSTTCVHTFDNEVAATREYEAASRHSRTYTNISIEKREVKS